MFNIHDHILFTYKYLKLVYSLHIYVYVYC